MIMNNRTIRPIAMLVIALVAVAGLAGALFFRTAPAPVQAQEAGTIPQPRTVTVVGEGQVSIEPDIAQATIGVEVVSPSVQEASAEASATLEAVLDALREQGIAEEDLQTSGFSIYSERSFAPEGVGGAGEINYRVSNNVSVTIRQLDTVGAVLESAIAAGANNIYGVTFRLEEPGSVESEARQRAIEDAAAKAEELASLNGLTVGPVVSISEIVGSGGGFYSGNFVEERASGFGGGAAPILPGQLTLTMQLEIVYTLQ